MDREKFSAFIAKSRREAGLTQRELARRLHITDKAVSKWERALCYPDVTLLEQLAEELGLTMAELIACRRQEEPPAPEPSEAVLALLDISGETVQSHRRQSRRQVGILTALVILLLAALAALSWHGIHIKERTWSALADKERTEDGSGYVYLTQGNHILQLCCGEKVDFDAIAADGVQIYQLEYTWNRLTGRGTLEGCESTGQEVLGTLMDEIGSGQGVDELLGIDCVWQEMVNCYPDVGREGGYLFTYRYYYTGDGSEYQFETTPGEETTLLTAEDCRNTVQRDYDGDGVVELLVLTRYEERPYMVYDLEDGEITGKYVDSVPAEIEEILRQRW